MICAALVLRTIVDFRGLHLSRHSVAGDQLLLVRVQPRDEERIACRAGDERSACWAGNCTRGGQESKKRKLPRKQLNAKKTGALAAVACATGPSIFQGPSRVRQIQSVPGTSRVRRNVLSTRSLPGRDLVDKTSRADCMYMLRSCSHVAPTVRGRALCIHHDDDLGPPDRANCSHVPLLPTVRPQIQ